MLQAIFIIVVLVIPECSARDALQYFVENRILHNSSFTILTNVNATDVVWMEYEYRFKSNTHEELKNNKSIEQVLNIGFFENSNTPFDCKFYPENGTLNDGKFNGYSFEIVKLLKELLHFRINYIKLNYSTSERNLTDALLLQKIDLLICHPGVNYEMESELSQLHSTLKSNYVLIYKLSKVHFTKDIFILTFAGTLWLCFLVLLIILAICLHIATKRYSILYSNYELWNWVDITLWANAAACQQGLSHTPYGFASRCIFFLGYLTAYLLYTGFAAGITSLLLQQGANNDITISDLEAMNLKTVAVMDMPTVKNANRFFSNNSLPVGNMDDLFIHIEQDNTVGIAPQIFVEQYFASKFNYDMISLYSTLVLTTPHYSRGFVMLKRNIYKQNLNNGLLTLQETGLLTNALYQNLLPPPARVISSNYSSAGIEHVGSAILILLVGTLSSTVFLVVELMTALYKSRCSNHSKTDDAEYFTTYPERF